MKTLVINLAEASRRRAFQVDQAARYGLDPEFVAARDATELPRDYCQASANEWTRPIAGKDIGC